MVNISEWLFKMTKLNWSIAIFKSLKSFFKLQLNSKLTYQKHFKNAYQITIKAMVKQFKILLGQIAIEEWSKPESKL